MNTRNILCVLTASAFISGMLGSCSLFEARDKTAVCDVMTGYLESVQQADYDASKSFVEDEADYFADNAMSDNDAVLIAAIWDNTEFDVNDIVIDGTTATASVIFSFPDLESITEEGYSFDEFVEAIPGIDDTTEQTLEFEADKEDENWLIESGSTEDLYNLIISLIEDLEFNELTEERAIEAVDTFIGLMAQGDLANAAAMLNATDNTYYTYAQAVSSAGGALDGINAVFSNYFDRAEYESEASEVTDEYIIVTVTGTAPDLQGAVDAVLDNGDVMVPIYADYVEAYINNNVNLFVIAGSLFDEVAAEVSEVQIIPLEAQFKVTMGDDGQLYLEPLSGPEIDVDAGSLTSRTDYIAAAIMQLFREGRITIDQIDDIQQMMGV